VRISSSTSVQSVFPESRKEEENLRMAVLFPERVHVIGIKSLDPAFRSLRNKVKPCQYQITSRKIHPSLQKILLLIPTEEFPDMFPDRSNLQARRKRYFKNDLCRLTLMNRSATLRKALQQEEDNWRMLMLFYVECT